jgi:hypothetical protein
MSGGELLINKSYQQQHDVFIIDTVTSNKNFIRLANRKIDVLQ